MRLTGNFEDEAAYLYLTGIAGGSVAKTVVYESDDFPIKGMINIDLDRDGRLLGIEAVPARIFPRELFEHAPRTG